jgi:D-glycero-D-manno-heptose 1,7-bisphosphate phosphatase
MAARVVFLDRDGTVNVDRGYVSRIEDWQFTERAVDALRLLQTAGFRLAVVTNQSGIARGYYRLEDMHALHDHLRRQLEQAGVVLDALAFCPHAEQPPCDCRKPRTGMATQVAAQLSEPIDYAASWTIGDKVSDLAFGAALGTRVALIRSRYWQHSDLPLAPTLVADSLYAAAVQLTRAANPTTASSDG